MEKRYSFYGLYTARETWNFFSKGGGFRRRSLKPKAPLVRRGLNNCQSVRYLPSTLIIAPVFQDDDYY
jgi:hypothetical protein